MTMIPPALKNLLGSEKAFAGGVLIVCATVLAAIGKMTVMEWADYSKWIFMTYVVGKTVQGIGEKVAGSGEAPEAPSGIGTSPSGIGTSPAKDA